MAFGRRKNSVSGRATYLNTGQKHHDKKVLNYYKPRRAPPRVPDAGRDLMRVQRRFSEDEEMSPDELQRLKNKLKAAAVQDPQGARYVRLFTKMDVDGNSAIDFDEFCIGVKKRAKFLMTDREAFFLWKAIDSNGDGKIELEELMNFCNSEGPLQRESAAHEATFATSSKKRYWVEYFAPKANNPYLQTFESATECEKGGRQFDATERQYYVIVRIENTATGIRSWKVYGPRKNTMDDSISLMLLSIAESREDAMAMKATYEQETVY